MSNEELKKQEVFNRLRILSRGHLTVLQAGLAHMVLLEDDQEAVDLLNHVRQMVKDEGTEEFYDFESYMNYCTRMKEFAEKTNQDTSAFYMGEIIDYFQINKEMVAEVLAGIRRDKVFNEIRRNFWSN